MRRRFASPGAEGKPAPVAGISAEGYAGSAACVKDEASTVVALVEGDTQ
jgi:hypothetical protein